MDKTETKKQRVILDQDGNPVSFDDLADIRGVVIDASLPQAERTQSFIRQIKNPYLFRCEDMVIRASFPKNGVTITDLLKQYLLSASKVQSFENSL